MRITFYRLTFCYTVSIIMVGLVVSADDAALHSAATGTPAVSPFIIAINNAGVKGLASVFNAVILIATFEVANSSLYATSRTMAALAEQRQATRLLAYIDRNGRPMVAILLALLISLLSYVGTKSTGSPVAVLQWFVAISALAGILNWSSICLCHVRFRQAWRYQGHTLDRLAFRSIFGVLGSYCALVVFALLLILIFWVAVDPIGAGQMDGNARAVNLFPSLPDHAGHPALFWPVQAVLSHERCGQRVDEPLDRRSTPDSRAHPRGGACQAQETAVVSCPVRTRARSKILGTG